MSAPIAPATTTAPVAGSVAGIYTFASNVDTVMIDNLAVGVDLYVRFDGAAATASSGGYQLRVMNNYGVIQRCGDLLIGGQLNKLSIWVPTGGQVANIRISGWREGA